MGFSWSSCICQEVALLYCVQAALDSTKLLADDADSPDDPSDVFIVTTDDVVTFNSNSKEAACATAEKLDAAMAKHGVEKHGAKDTTGSLNGTVIGIDSVDGCQLGPQGDSLTAFLRRAIALLRCRAASPLQVNALIGRWHWYNQLNRPLYSILNYVYKLTQRTPEYVVRVLPSEVVAEIALCIMLAPN